MKKPLLRNVWLPVVLAGALVLLDLLVDRLMGDGSGIGLPHVILMGLVLLTLFVVVRQATAAHRRAEAVLRQARDELEVRVQERTAELERTHAALRRVNERLEFTQAASGAGSWDWDIPSGRLGWSPKMFDLFGLDMRTAAASFDTWRSVLHPEDREAAERRINVALDTHSDLASEYRIIWPDGRLHWISALGKGFYDEQGQPIRMSGLCFDITDRRFAEAEVEHLSSFPQLNPNPVLEIDPSGTIVLQNASTVKAIERLGLRDSARAFLPDDLAVILQELSQKKESEFQREVRVGDATFSETVQVLPAFNVVRIYAFEITKRKQAEEALRSAQLQVEAEKRHLEAVLQALPVGVIITDAQGGVLLTNGMDAQIWGTRPITHAVDDYAQYKAWWADSGKPVESHEWASAQAVENGESVFGQVLEIQRFDGGHSFVLNSAVPIRDAEGRVIGSAVAIQDITELRRAEQALRQSEERFRTVVENSRDGINMLDPETGRYVFMSPAQVKLTGFSAEEMNDLPVEEAYDRVHPDDREKSVSQQRQIAEGRDQGSTVEYRWKVKSGEYRWFSDSRKAVRDEQGRVVALVGVSRDITDQKRAEEALRASEEKYRLLFQNMGEGFAVYELLYDEEGVPADWRILEVNNAYARHTGFTRERIVGRRASELFPASVPEYLPRFAAVVAAQEHQVFETYAKVVDRYQRVVTFPAGGHRFASTIQDITERRRSDQALREKEAELVDAQRIARIGSWFWDARTDAVTGSAEVLRIFGFDPETQVMPALREQRGRCYPEEEWKRINAAVQMALETGTGYQLDVQALCNGTLIWVTVRGEVVRDARGQIAGLRGTVQDITERKHAEEELRLREAELALASHERVIIEERQRLARELHDSVSQALYGISLGVNTALTLLDVDRNKVLEALDYSLLQTQAALAEMRSLIFALRPEALAAEGVVVALSRVTAALIARRDIEIELSLCDEPDVSLEVKEALYRIAQEALQNAVKHARCSRLQVRLTRDKDGLSLEMIDNGVGFDPLASYPGHLGLLSMRERALRAGGTLDIASAPDCGTLIRVHVPIPPAQPASSM